MSELEIEDHGHVRVLRINRPEARNALSPAVIDGIGFGLEDADQDDGVRAIVLIGTGDRAFCAGMDLAGFVSGNGGERDPRGMELFLQFRQRGARKPVVGAANAAAVAGGFELLMGCDVVVASSHARFGLPEVKRGLFPAGGGVFLASRIPRALAAELLLTGDLIDAQRAYEMGMVNKIVEPDQVLSSAIEMAERMAANGPLALDVIKQLVHAVTTGPAEDAWALQAQLQPVVFGSEDAKEGASAFLEKRDPQWRGR